MLSSIASSLETFGAFGDVERAVVEGETVRTIEAGGDDLGLALAAPLDDRIDLVAIAVAHEHGALVAEAERARVRQSADVDLDPEARRQLQHGRRQLLGRGRERRLRNAPYPGADFRIGRPADDPLSGLRRLLCRGGVCDEQECRGCEHDPRSVRKTGGHAILRSWKLDPNAHGTDERRHTRPALVVACASSVRQVAPRRNRNSCRRRQRATQRKTGPLRVRY